MTKSHVFFWSHDTDSRAIEMNSLTISNQYPFFQINDIDNLIYKSVSITYQMLLQ